jgi:hypothetical protein
MARLVLSLPAQQQLRVPGYHSCALVVKDALLCRPHFKRSIFRKQRRRLGAVRAI